MSATTNQKSAIKNVETLARLMDSRFRIPGTSIRFGVDALAGLIPGVGDFATLFVSGYIMTILAQNGASGFVLARMALNIIVDAVLGTVPVLGDIFDVAFKANIRNVQLLQEHYVEGRHKGGVWKIVLPLLVLLFLLIGFFAWLSYEVIVWVIGQF